MKIYIENSSWLNIGDFFYQNLSLIFLKKYLQLNNLKLNALMHQSKDLSKLIINFF